jgi:hypothetical protein
MPTRRRGGAAPLARCALLPVRPPWPLAEQLGMPAFTSRTAGLPGHKRGLG